MSAKIAAFFVTFIANIAAGIVIFLMMLIALNGFGESDATWGLGAFIVMAIIVASLMSVGAVLLVHLLQKKVILEGRFRIDRYTGFVDCGYGPFARL